MRTTHHHHELAEEASILALDMMNLRECSPSIELVNSLPKVLLHDHLDGGVRPQTLIELIKELGEECRLPAGDPVSLQKYIFDKASAGSLVEYLQCFELTLLVMQRLDFLERIAYECVLDLADDNVVYAEVRYAPSLFLRNNHTVVEVTRAIAKGFRRGMDTVESQGRPIRVRSLVCAIRHQSVGEAIPLVDLFREYAQEFDIAGCDLAGAEANFPAAPFIDEVFTPLSNLGARLTIHAGEDGGLDSLEEAINDCKASRIGHGIRLVEDIINKDCEDGKECENQIILGHLAQHVYESGLILEVCPTSNVQTGAVVDVATHPISQLFEAGIRVTVNTDNRLMSSTTLSKEFTNLVDHANWSLADILTTTFHAINSIFVDNDDARRWVRLSAMRPLLMEVLKLHFPRLERPIPLPIEEHPETPSPLPSN